MNVRKAYRGEELQAVPNGRRPSRERDLNYEPGGSAGQFRSPTKNTGNSLADPQLFEARSAKPDVL